MKKILIALAAFVITAGQAMALEPIKLSQPDLKRGSSLMEALSQRKTVREYAARELSAKDLSDLLWAATGVNRQSEGKLTAPSAMNRQDIKVYVALANGAYLYNPKTHTLEPIQAGDFRQKMRDNMPAANLVLVADDGDFRFADVDAGYISQNIYLFCSANNLGTVAAGMMDRDAYKNAFKLNDKQKIVVQHPVGYTK